MKSELQQLVKSVAPSAIHLKKLEEKAESAKKAVEKTQAALEQEAVNYHKAMQAATNKIAVLQAEASRKIAKLAHKIKKTEYKLAKAALKFAVKELKKLEQKAPKAMAEAKAGRKVTTTKPKATAPKATSEKSTVATTMEAKPKAVKKVVKTSKTGAAS